MHIEACPMPESQQTLEPDRKLLKSIKASIIRHSFEGNSYVSGSKAKRISVWPARFVANKGLTVTVFSLLLTFRSDT